MKNIILTGFMGTGKSSVGQCLADKIGYEYCDLDGLIVQEAGCTINDIFDQYGEAYFRELESTVLQRIVAKRNKVISTGGGAVLRDENRLLLHASGVVVNLVASPEVILKRLLDDSARPLLKESKSLERVTAMLAERESCYADADVRIDTDGKKVEDVVVEILAYFKEKY